MGTEMSLFDSPWHIIILLVVILVLFGSKRMPGAAQSLGQSMHIFKRSMKGLADEDQPDGTTGFTQASYIPQNSQQPGQPGQQQWPAPPQQLTSPAQTPPLATSVPGATNQTQIDDLQRQIAELQRLSAAGNGTGAAVSDSPPSSPSL